MTSLVLTLGLAAGQTLLATEVKAVDLFAEDGNPTVFFNDTSNDTPSWGNQDWEIRARNATDSSAGFLRVQNERSDLSGLLLFDNAPHAAFVGGLGPGNVGLANGDLTVDPDSDYVGVGTTSPTEELTITTDESVLDIELDVPSTFDGQQTWNISLGGNGLFFSDQEALTTPVKLENGAPSNSFVIGSNGNVAVGGTSIFPDPAKALHVLAADANQLGQNNTMLRVENPSDTQAPRRMIELINNGSPLLVYQDTARGTIWNMSPVGNSFVISLSGTGAQEFRMDGNGNAEFQGDVTANGVVLDSSRALKTGITPVDTHTVLKKVAALEVTRWRYKEEDGAERHIGPMAEDFQALFGVGDGKHLDMVDTTGVTLAAIKALAAENREKAERIAELEGRIERLEIHITR